MTRSIAQPRQIRKTLEEWREDVVKLLNFAAARGAGLEAIYIADSEGAYTAEDLTKIVGSLGARVPAEVIADAATSVDRTGGRETSGRGGMATVIRVWLEPQGGAE